MPLFANSSKRDRAAKNNFENTEPALEPERVLLYREMDGITLKEMTKELCRELFRGYEYEQMIFADMSAFKPY